MPMVRAHACLLALAIPILAPASLAVSFNDGAHHVIDGASSFPFEGVDVLDGPGATTTSADLVAGGSIGTSIPSGSFTAYDSSSIAVTGGTVNGHVQGFDCSTISVSGGTSNQVRADDGAIANFAGGTAFAVRSGPGGTANVSGGTLTNVGSALSGVVHITGGTILGELAAEGPGWITMSGGSVADGVRVNGSGRITISGGSVSGQILAEEASGARIFLTGGNILGDLLALGPATIEIQGSGFNFPLGDIPSTAGTLTGTLADGTPINVPFARASTAKITLAAPAAPACAGTPPCAPLVSGEIVYASTRDDDGLLLSDTSIETVAALLTRQRFIFGPFPFHDDPIIDLGTDLEIDGAGRIYFVRDSELVRLDPASGQETRIVCNGAFSRFELHPNGLLYALEGANLVEVDPALGSVVVLAVLPETGTSIAVGDDGDLLVTGALQLYEVDPTTGAFSAILTLSFMGNGSGFFGPPAVEVVDGEIFLGGTQSLATSALQAAAVWSFDGTTVTEIAEFDGLVVPDGWNYQIRDMEVDANGDLILAMRVPQPGCAATCTDLRNLLGRLDPTTGIFVEGPELIAGSVGTTFAGHAVFQPGTQCGDGVDNDGDGLIDLADPACKDAAWPAEQTQCQDGANNDADAGIDFDGGASIHGTAIAPPDAQCASFWDDREGSKNLHCGLGLELALVLPCLGWLRARRARR